MAYPTLPAAHATAQANNPPAPAATLGQGIPETDPAYLAFANGQGWRESEARAYTAMKQNAVHQAFQDQLPGMVLAGQKQALATTNQFGDRGAWRTGARIQGQARDASELQDKITQANNAQQRQQDDLQAQLAAHIINLRQDTTMASLQARENAAAQAASAGQQAFMNNQAATASPVAMPPTPYAPTAPLPTTGIVAPAPTDTGRGSDNTPNSTSSAKGAF